MKGNKLITSLRLPTFAKGNKISKTKTSFFFLAANVFNKLQKIDSIRSEIRTFIHTLSACHWNDMRTVGFHLDMHVLHCAAQLLPHPLKTNRVRVARWPPPDKPPPPADGGGPTAGGGFPAAAGPYPSRWGNRCQRRKHWSSRISISQMFVMNTTLGHRLFWSITCIRWCIIT